MDYYKCKGYYFKEKGWDGLKTKECKGPCIKLSNPYNHREYKCENYRGWNYHPDFKDDFSWISETIEVGQCVMIHCDRPTSIAYIGDLNEI